MSGDDGTLMAEGGEAGGGGTQPARPGRLDDEGGRAEPNGASRRRAPRRPAQRPAFSIIIPALDEAKLIGGTLGALTGLRDHGHEVLVVDGGSRDATPELAAPLADAVLKAPRGRASQMNAGAAHARGRWLLFLHADTRLPVEAPLVLERIERSGAAWGRFDLRLEGRHPLLPLVATLINLRSRLTGIATGDQAIFVRRDLFDGCGGYDPLPLMEDVALSRKLKRRAGRPLCLGEPALTSARRWEERGLLRTILQMWWIRLLYAVGVEPSRLAELYR